VLPKPGTGKQRAEKKFVEAEMLAGSRVPIDTIFNGSRLG
jgi:hypothetical protein